MERSVHASFVTPAVPNWKIFIYGGHGTDREKASNNMSVYSDTVQMLECKVGEPYGARSAGVMAFQTLQPQINDSDRNTKVPRGRADTEAVFDEKNQRLLFFGGWANRWFKNV